MTDTLVKIISPITTVTVSDKINVINIKDKIAVATIGIQGPPGTPGGLFLGGFSVFNHDHLITVVDRQVILVDASSNPRIITLDLATSLLNRHFYIKKIDLTNNFVTIQTSDGEMLDFDTFWTLELPGEDLEIGSDGTQWWIL